MVMKDKLIKNHHKGSYYRARQFGLGFAISLGAAFLIGVPTYISINNSIQATRALDNPDDDDENGKVDSNGVVADLISYIEGK